MITLNKFDNKDSRHACTSCHTMKEKTMYELLIGYGNGGMLMYLCPQCARDLKQKTNTFITTYKIFGYYENGACMGEVYGKFNSLEEAQLKLKEIKENNLKQPPQFNKYEIVEE